MFKLLKFFTPFQWVLTFFLFSFLVAQCYCDVTLPVYTAELVSKMQSKEPTSSLLSTGGVMLMYAGISIACTIIVTFIAFKLSTTHAKRLRAEIYKKVEAFSMEEMSRFSTASLITRTTNDVQQVAGTTMLLLRIGLSAPLVAVLALIKINNASFELTFAMGIGISFLIAGIMTIMFIAIPKFKIIQKLIDKLNGVTRENLTGIRIIRAFNAEQLQKDKFSDANNNLTKTNIFTNRVMGLMMPIITLVNYALTLTVYWLGSFIIVRDNNPAFFPIMFSFTQLAAQVVMSFMLIIMIFMMLPRAQVSASRINEVLKTTPYITDSVNPLPLPKGGEIEFVDVSFAYPNAEESVLSNINLKIHSGETAAFIGLTGSGKSTLIHLIPRFFEATGGRVLVNGVNVKDTTQAELKNLIGYIPQTNILFSGTVRENIALGATAFSEDDLKLAAQISCAEEFIEALPEKFNTAVSQGGKNFSGGQKQRLSIARAVLKKPDIYIFDDSFSALDYKTDKLVRENLKEYAKDATKIIVAQRIGTILDADKIFVLNNGKIIGNGTHKELIASCEDYRQIALSQLSEEELSI